MGVKEGERFRVLEEHPHSVLTSWSAPFTGGNDCVLPAGLVLVADGDQVPGASGFGCVPENYEEAEPLLVPEEDRSHAKYAGYYLVLLEDEIGTWFERI